MNTSIWPLRAGLASAVIVMAATACGGGGGTAEPATGSGETIEQHMDGLAAAGRFTGSVIVARGSTIVLRKSYGWADAEQHVANTPQTRFRIGSNSKQFTAMAIALLQQQGSLSASDGVCSYVVACPVAWQTITISHLLTHTSGLPDYTNFDTFPALIGTAVAVPALIDRFKSLPLERAPGSRWSYSNSNYVVLGSIIEQVSGMSYADFLQSRIFTPLQMTATGYDSSAITEPTHAQGYLAPGRRPVFIDMSEFYAAGALYSTVDDMLLWDRAVLASRLVPAAVMATLLSPVVPCPAGGCLKAADVGYGWGWFVADDAQTRYDYHWGRIDGFVSSNLIYPAEQVSVVVLSNLETSDVFGSADLVGHLAAAASGASAP